MLPDRLKGERKKRKLTQEELADRLGIARSTYSGYETGKTEPDFNTLEKIADYLEVSYDYLLGRTNDPKRILQPHSRKMIDLLDQDLSDEEIYQAFNEQFLVGGIPMNKDEALFFINYLRTKRAIEMKRDHASKQ